MTTTSSPDLVTDQSPTPRWLTVVAITLVLTVVMSAFALSFTVLRDLAALAGIPDEVSWLWPVIVDGTIAAATLVLYASRGHARGAKVLSSLTLALFAGISIVGNVAHILLVDPSQVVPAAIAVFTGVVPPIGLILTVEMLVKLLSSKGADHESVVTESPVEFLAEAPTDHGQPALVISEPSESVDGTVITPAKHDSTALTVLTESTIHDLTTPTAEPVMTESADQMLPQLIAPVTTPPALHAIETIPNEPSDQVDWIVDRARAGGDVAKKTLLQIFEEAGQSMSPSTAQRRLREARQQAPEAFGEAIETDALERVS